MSLLNKRRVWLKIAAKNSFKRAVLSAIIAFLSVLLAGLKDLGQFTIIVIVSALLSAVIEFFRVYKEMRVYGKSAAVGGPYS